ncbi:MAG: murein peptide amidase A [Bdellovibrionaceae bacterium]|nr:murein peptide amidase A [Pseudobdellovibrionaceae bacterium]
MSILVLLSSFFISFYINSFATAQEQESAPTPAALPINELCFQQLKTLPGPFDEAELKAVCQKMVQTEGCVSAEGTPIYHYEKKGTDKNPKKIFAKALIHGDEGLSGSVARAWILRLEKIDPRNTWRVMPVTNPDGWKLNTRTNSKGVDLNRNFPTKDWEEQAISYWKKRMKSDPRRYPGPEPASEIETKCLIKHFDEFKPDFLISVHIPLGVLDFDGPKVKNPPRFSPLPWISLGNFPGSLGRFMWADRKVPVLTIELKGNEDVKKLEAFDKLQDISGTVAIQADQINTAKKKSAK